MEDIVALVMVFGCGMVAIVAFSPLGRAIAERIRGRVEPAADPAIYEELERMRTELSELQERVDFTERMLSRSREREALPGAE
jgi:hypothetical protein